VLTSLWSGRVGWFARAVVAASTLALALGGTAGARGGSWRTAEEDEPKGRLMLVLDSSGSMKEPDASGSTKIDAAKQALTTVVEGLPSNAQVGLRVYGATVFEKSDRGACTDSQVVVPIGPVDKPGLKGAIGRFRPYGETPIAYSLEQAANDVGTTGQRTILLVSDGEETCDPDPCKVAERIHEQGIDLKIDVVGLHVDATTRSQLECIATSGGGRFYDVGDAQEMAASLERSSFRAFRGFEVSGTPVKGTLQPEDAPEIGPGQYTDTLGQWDEVTGQKYYTVRRGAPGSTVHVAVTTRPAQRSRGVIHSDRTYLTLRNAKGEDCAYAHNATVDDSSEHGFVTTTVFVGTTGSTDGWSYDTAGCDSDPLTLEVARWEPKDGRKTSPDPIVDPIELVIIEEPPVENADSLPGPVGETDVPQGPPSGAGTTKTVAGGSGFTDAPTLEPGTWNDTIQPGEQLFYRVHADWGQSPSASFEVPEFKGKAGVALECPSVDLLTYGPNRQPADAELLDGARTGGLCSDTFNVTFAPARYRNREVTTFSQASLLAGFYYFAISLANDGERLQTPLQIKVGLIGEVAGAPDYQGEDPTKERPNAPPTSASPPDGGDDAGPDESTSAGGTGRPDEAAPTSAEGPFTPAAVAGGVGGLVILTALGVLVALLRRPRRVVVEHAPPGWSPRHPPHQMPPPPPVPPGPPTQPPPRAPGGQHASPRHPYGRPDDPPPRA
jgi:Ca-activated chloride channel homolog